jgi:hypothetical protein
VLPQNQPSAFLVGRVVDGQGRVPEHTSVLAAQVETRAGDSHPIDSRTGEFRCGPLVPGEWDLAVLAQGHTTLMAGRFALGADETRDVGEIVLPAPARVVLRVRLDAGVTADRVNCGLEPKGGGRASELHLAEGVEPVWISGPLEPGDYVVNLGWSSGGAEDAFVLPTHAEVHAEAGRDTLVEMFAERGVAQTIHVTTLRAPPPRTTVLVTDSAHAEIVRREVDWDEPRPDEAEHEDWVSFVGRPGSYVMRIESEEGFVLERGLNLAGGANTAARVEVAVP